MAVDYTFVRPSPATVVDHEGIIRNCKIDEARFANARRVENLATGVVTEVVPVIDGNQYQVTIRGDNAATAVCSGAFTEALTADGANRISWPNGVPKVAGSTLLTVTVTGTLTELQVEAVSDQSNQNPSEYVSNGLGEDHGCGKNVDGVKYFDYKNGNTVDANGVVTEKQGSALQNVAYLNEGSATNSILTSADFSMTSDGTTEWGGGDLTAFPVVNILPSIFPGGIAFQAVEKSSASRSRGSSSFDAVVVNGEDKMWMVSSYIEVFPEPDVLTVTLGCYDSSGSAWGASGQLQYNPYTEEITSSQITNDDATANAVVLTTKGVNGGTIVRIDNGFNAKHFTGTKKYYIYPMSTGTPLVGGTTIIHGAQLEEAPGPSSFIITGSIAETRAADKLFYSNVAVNKDFVAACDLTPAFDGKDVPGNGNRHFGTDDSRGANYEIRSAGGSNIGAWTLTPTTGGGYFGIPASAELKDVREKCVFTAAQNGDDVDFATYFNGGLKQQSPIPMTLDHSTDNIYAVGHWPGSEVMSCLYHTFQLFDKPLTDEQLEYISQPGNNPQGCS